MNIHVTIFKEFHPQESSISDKKERLTVLSLSLSNIFSSSKCPITSFLIFQTPPCFCETFGLPLFSQNVL